MSNDIGISACHGQVILLHGLHMHAWVMRPLAKRLEQQGFITDCFGYHSVLQSVFDHSDRLASWLNKKHKKNLPLYLIGHSLGGLVIRHFLHRHPDWQVSGCVSIGTPHHGSFCAKRMQSLAPSLMGKAYVWGLDGQAPCIRAGVALGSIAGSVSVGLGRLVLPNSHEQNDGTVFVHETKVDSKIASVYDNITIPASHTGMIFDPQVAWQAGYFLRYKCFDRGYQSSITG